MADRGNSQRASWRFVAPRIAACAALVVGTAIVTAAPASAAAPSAPTITSLIAGPAVGLMSLKWSRPLSSGGAAITGYEYRVQIDNGPFSLASALSPPNIKRATAPCLAPAPAGVCNYEVRATNGTGGAWSTPVGASWSVPSVPTLGRALAGPAAGVATLSWRAPKTSGGLPVTYQYTVNGGSGWSALTDIDPNSITVAPGHFAVLSATLPCVISGPVNGCSYIVNARNSVGASGSSQPRTGILRRPGPPTDLQIVTSSVALGTGAASQSLTWNAPVNVGGQALTDYQVLACATSTGSDCTNNSPGWLQFIDIVGNPPDTATTHDCPANGRCAYEVWAKNASGKGWTVAFAGPSPPSAFVATASTTTSGQVDLSWLDPVDTGTAFGHFVLFECGAAADLLEWNVDECSR